MMTGSKWRIGALVAALVAGAGSVPVRADETETARVAIWTLEQAIYEGRSKGDVSAYANTTAKGYMAWPPVLAAPMRVDGFDAALANPQASQEELAMELIDFTLHGETAIIYYRTHRTRLADGTPADDRFDVTHTWIREDGAWRVLGGMARSQVLP